MLLLLTSRLGLGSVQCEVIDHCHRLPASLLEAFDCTSTFKGLTLSTVSTGRNQTQFRTKYKKCSPELNTALPSYREVCFGSVKHYPSVF